MAYICTDCGKQFASVKSLCSHKAVQDTEEYVCETCEKTCVGSKSLNNHKKTHEKFTCPVCKQEMPFTTKSTHVKKMF